MKRLVNSVAALLLCFTTYAQNGESFEWSIIPRLDYSTTDSFTSSSIHSTFGGNITENLSLDGYVQFMSDSPSSLYGNTTYSNDVNWLKILNLSYTVGDMTFSFGKNCIFTYGCEDYYDHDEHIELATTLWQSLAPYQWSWDMTYGLTDELSFSFQMFTSPYGERPWSKLFGYSIPISYDSDSIFATLAFTTMNGYDGARTDIISSGFRGYIGDVSLSLTYDFMKAKELALIPEGHCLRFDAVWEQGNHFDFFARALYDNVVLDSELASSRSFVRAGVGAYLYPLRNRDIKIHLLTGYTGLENSVLFDFGITYNLSILR